jgi:Raf kinase inhibitor-like YbhB/YbcL family protein
MKPFKRAWWSLFRTTLAAAVGGLVGLPGCRAEAPPAKPKGETRMSIRLTSSAFANGQPIPKKYTGEGADVSPPLAWSNLPEATKELALICDDPDAPTPEPWVHWVIYKIPASLAGLPEGVARDVRLKNPPGALQGQNSWPKGKGNIGYRGPMPPPGGTHHYHFKLYALEAHLSADSGLDKKALLLEIQEHVLAAGELVGTYER